MSIWDWTCVILVSQFHRIESEMFNLMCTCHDHEIQINDVYNIYIYIIIYEFIPARPKKIPSRVAPSECSGSRGCNACLAIAFSGGLLHTIYLLYIYNYLPIISGWNDQLAGSSSIGSGVKLIVCLRRGVDGPPTFWAIEISSSEGPRSSCCGPHSF